MTPNECDLFPKIEDVGLCEGLHVPDDAEEVDVAVVDREVEEHSSGASIQP